MYYGKLTRDEAVAMAGSTAVEAAERDNCQPSGRLMGDADDDVVEYVGFGKCPADSPYTGVQVYDYPSIEDLDANADDLGGVNWEIEGYEVL